MYNTKSAAASAAVAPVGGDGKISVKIQYPDTTTTRMQLSPDMKLQEILTTICYQQVLHVDKHTLIIINNGKEEDPRMDKPLNYYKNIQKILVKYSGPPEDDSVSYRRRTTILAPSNTNTASRMFNPSEYSSSPAEAFSDMPNTGSIGRRRRTNIIEGGTLGGIPLPPSANRPQTVSSVPPVPSLPSHLKSSSVPLTQEESSSSNDKGSWKSAKTRIKLLSNFMFKKSSQDISEASRISVGSLPVGYMNTISAANKISASRDSLKKSNSALDGGKSNGALDGGKSNSALRAVEGSGPLDVDPNLPKIAISNYSLGSDSVHSADNEAKLDRSRMGFGYVNGGRSISFIDGQQHTNMSRINALTMPADISYLEKAGADFGVEFQDLLSQYSLNSAGGSNTDIHRHGAAASTVDPDNRLSAHVYNTSRLSIASTSDGDSIKSRQSLGVPDDIDENASPSRISASEEVRKFVRKRVVSTGVDTEKSSLLRKNTIVNATPKSQLIEGVDILTVANETNLSILNILLPNNQTLTLKVDSDKLAEDVLSILCSRRGLEYGEHTFLLPNKEKVSMDKPIKLIAPIGIPTEISVIKSQKKYDTVCLSENGRDVLVLRNDGNRQIVMAGIVEKLIEYSTDPEHPDDNYLDELLMSFRSFTTAISFFDHLVARYNAELPPDPTEDDIMYFRRVKIPVQKRVIHVLKRWTMHHWHDFGKLSQLKSDLEEFTESCEYINDVQELRNIMEEQQTKYEALINSVSITPSRKKGRESLLLEFTVDDVSAQMCLHNFNLFKQIHPIEFLDQIWGKPGDENSATPSLNFFIARFDQESYWVATEILMQKDMKKRVQVLSNMILIAKRCQEYNNFFSMFAMVAGLNLTPIQKLKKTWEAIPEKVQKAFDELERIIDPSKNMKNFRELLAAAEKKPPILPFLPIYLKDLTFMNDGNQSKVNGLINFDKLRMMAKRVKDISGLVKINYKFENDPTIANYIANPIIEKDLKKLKEWALEMKES